MAADALTKRIWAIVRRIPRGRVATYGELGARLGLPAGHRRVARAMTVCPPGLPWHRVVGKKDARRAVIRILDPRTAADQRARLEREGVAIDDEGRISLERFGWGRARRVSGSSSSL
jgi:methylated-DNA-protein-cysteine methyltransferase-like protein